MKSEWMIETDFCSDIAYYRIYRLADKGDEDSEKEYKDEVYYRKDMAIEAAEKANVKENAERFWRGCN